MSAAVEAVVKGPEPASQAQAQAPKGMRKNGMNIPVFLIVSYYPIQIHILTYLPRRFTGKNWHDNKTAFRPTAGQTTYAKRVEERKAREAMKEKEKGMKDEKEAERQVCCLHTSSCFT